MKNLIINTDKIILAMARRKFTIRDLCEKSGISSVTIWKIRNGNQRVRLDTIGLVAEALGIDVNEIVTVKS